MSEDQVRNLLRQQGYSDVSSVRKEGDKFEAKAMKDGKAVTIEIDSTGKITDKSS